MQPSPKPVVPEVISANTGQVAGPEKFDFWHDVVCRTVVDLECVPTGDAPFEASVHGVRLNGLNVARIEATPHSVSRLPSAITRSVADALVFNFVMSGQALADQDGRSVLLSPGDGAVCDAERPYSLRFDAPFKILAVKIPRTSLAQGAGSIHRVTASSLSQAGQLCPIVFAYLAGLCERGPSLGAASAEKVSGNFVELLGAALDEAVANRPVPLSECRAAALMRVRDFVERNLGDGDLDPATVASALKLSPRYMNKLFEAEGTSLVRYVWGRRLERAAADLRNPALQAVAISVIAMNHGFNDLSHFSRVFRERYGMPPRSYRFEGPGRA
jgi:AraC family transcriptional activator of tynA and feaB